MDQKVIKGLAENVKTIKVSGQSAFENCLTDCPHYIEKEVTYATPYSGCYKTEYVVVGIIYNAMWSPIM